MSEPSGWWNGDWDTLEESIRVLVREEMQKKLEEDNRREFEFPTMPFVRREGEYPWRGNDEPKPEKPEGDDPRAGTLMKGVDVPWWKNISGVQFTIPWLNRKGVTDDGRAEAPSDHGPGEAR